MYYLYQRHILRSNISDLTFCIESKKFNIEKTLVDYSDLDKSLDEREELKDMFYGELTSDDTLIVYELHELSSNVTELVRIFDCLFNRDITIFLCKYDTYINKDTDTLKTVRLLSSMIEEHEKSKASRMGRPKGKFSKSKFDHMQEEIIKLLKADLNVSQIARELGVSRTSLKDYINTRSLKEIINSDIKKEYADIPVSQCKEQV